MASSFPGSIDNFTDPLSNSALSSPSHAGQHSDLNDAVEKIETYMGLVKVIPTSVTNGTLAANGTVTIGNAVSSVSVTCFSSTYDNYRIILDYGDASAGGADVRLSLAGISAGWYWNGYYQQAASSTLTGQNGANQGFAVVGQTETDHYNFVCEVHSPSLAKQKYITSQYGAQGGNTLVGVYNAVNSSVVSAASFTLTPSSGTLTGGTIRVYGYRN